MVKNEPCIECGKMMSIEFGYGMCSQQCIDNWWKHKKETLEGIKKYYPFLYKMLELITISYKER